MGAPLGVKGFLGLHDNKHLEGVFKGNLLQGAVAEGVVDPTSIAVDLDMLFLVSCHCFQKIASFRCLVQGVMMKAPLLVGGLTEGKVQNKSFPLNCPAPPTESKHYAVGSYLVRLSLLATTCDYYIKECSEHIEL